MVDGDRRRLEQVLANLLDNAIRYSSDGGPIEIVVSRPSEDAAEVSVRDHGVGIPVEWRERIFEPFVRLDDSPRGAGIGLFAARRLARSLGGDLRVEPRLPKGTQFVLELAAASRQAAAVS